MFLLKQTFLREYKANSEILTCKEKILKKTPKPDISADLMYATAVKALSPPKYNI